MGSSESWETASSERLEAGPSEEDPSIRIRGLTKTFMSGKRRVKAVRGLSVDIFPGQVRSQNLRTGAPSWLSDFIPLSGLSVG